MTGASEASGLGFRAHRSSPIAGSTIVWKKDISPADGLQALQVDPHDRRHLCLCGGRGALTVLKLLNPARDRQVLARWCMAADLICSVSGKINRLHRRVWLKLKLHIAAHVGGPRQWHLPRLVTTWREKFELHDSTSHVVIERVHVRITACDISYRSGADATPSCRVHRSSNSSSTGHQQALVKLLCGVKLQ